MNFLFYLSAFIAVAATVMIITRTHAVHALLYLIVSLLAIALIFALLGAPFIAALEVIIYAGAIMVLFIFLIMTLSLDDESALQEKQWLSAAAWRGPVLLCLVLAAELGWFLITEHARLTAAAGISPKQIGIALFGPYMLAVELASMLLLAGLVGAYHLGRPSRID